MDLLNITPDIWAEKEVELLQQLQQTFDWNSIPLLNVNDVQNLEDRKLVRFFGMVQDMYNPEYYYEQYEVVNEQTKERTLKNGKFLELTRCKDSETVDCNSKNNVTKERHTLIVITTPGLNEWVHDINKDKYTITATPALPPENISKKRSLAPEEGMETESNESETSNKKQCMATSSTSKDSLSRDHLLNFPFPERSGKACQIKVYKDAEKIKLNDLVNIVGFLSVNPILTDLNSSDEWDSEMEVQTHHPPPSLIPRIHCVAFKKMPHCNPLVDSNILDIERIQYVKKELHIVLTQLLMGDSLAAEYFIYYLISRVYVRNNLLPLGKFALNLSHIPVLQIPEFGKRFYEFLELMVCTSHYLPMTLENMNKLPFIPKKDYECDRLTSGLLQLSSNTHLVLDETKLTSGRLNEMGVKAVQALDNTIRMQKISYDFNYYPVDFDCDIAFLILSEGKSMLCNDFHVPLRPDEICISTYDEILEAAKIFLKPELLHSVRIYLAQSRIGNYELNDDVNELVQNEFIRMRQTKKATADDLHQLLVLARLICLSEGKTQLDGTCWNRACELEEERKKRL